MHHVACVHYKYRNLCKEGLETGPVLLSSHCPLDIAGQHAPTLRLLVLQLKEEITANGHNSYDVVLEPVLVHCSLHKAAPNAAGTCLTFCSLTSKRC